MRRGLVLSSIFTMAFVINSQVFPTGFSSGQFRIADANRTVEMAKSRRLVLEVKGDKKMIKLKNLVI